MERGPYILSSQHLRGIYGPCPGKEHLACQPPITIDGWRWKHVRDLNVLAWRMRANRYSAGSITEAAADFLRVRPGGLLKFKHGSSVMPLAFGVKLLKFGRLLPAASCRGSLVAPLRG
jgi:hypothetical protein